MVEATQTTYTTVPTTAYDTTQQSTGIKGKLAQLKGKLSGSTATNEPYLTNQAIPPSTSYMGATGQQPILTTQQQPLLTQQGFPTTTAAPYPTTTSAAPLGTTSTLGPSLGTTTTGLGGTGIGPTTTMGTTGIGTTGLGTTGLGTTGAGIGTTGLGTTGAGIGATGLGVGAGVGVGGQSFVQQESLIGAQRGSIGGAFPAATSGLASGISSQRSSISATDSYLLQQQQPGFIGGGATTVTTGATTAAIQTAATEVIQERPVLDRVEKIIQKEVVQKPRIQEQFRQEIIEVHEKPIEKRFMHPVQEFRVQEQTQFEIQGKEAAELERNNLIFQLRERDRLHQVTVDQRQDVRMFQEAPLMSQSKEMRKEVIYKPIVTEIHEQPIREIHEQSIQRTIYEKPIVTVIRDQSIIENISSTQPLTGISYEATPLMTRQQQVIAQPILTQQQAVIPTQQNVIIEKGLSETLPHVVGTNLNPAEVDRMESGSFLRK